MLAGVRELNRNPVSDAVVHDRGDANSAGIGQRFQARGDVYAVTIDVVAVDDDVTQIDANPQSNAAIRIRIAPLNRERRLNRVDHAREFDQSSVAHQLYEPPPAFRNDRIENFRAMRLQRC